MLKKMLLTLGVLSMLTTFSSEQTLAEELNFVCLTNSAHVNTPYAIIPWIEDVAKKTDNKLQIIRFDVNTLVPVRENFTATINGFIDIGSNTVGDNPGVFPVHNVMQLPMMTYKSRTTSYAITELSKKYQSVRDEFNDIHLLWYWATPEYTINTTKKPIRTLEDIKGLRLLVWDNYVQEIVTRLGATPIMVPPLDSYLSLSRGMADGVVSPAAVLVSWKLGEVTKYHTRCNLTANVFWCGMNKDRWNSLSDDFKKVLTETSANMSVNCSTVTDIKGAGSELKWCADNGHEIITLSKEEHARWSELLKPMYQEWLNEMEKLGIKDAPDILRDAQALTQKRYDELVASGTL